MPSCLPSPLPRVHQHDREVDTPLCRLSKYLLGNSVLADKRGHEDVVTFGFGNKGS